jgi:hypothetical protein
MFGANDFQQIPWSSTFLIIGPQISVMGFFIYFLTVNLGLKKDFKESRVGLR